MNCTLNRSDETDLLSPKELEEFKQRVPVDDVWIRKHYPIQRVTFSDAIRMHRELASPEMFDNTDGLVFVDAELDMSTKKKVFVHKP